FSYQYCHNSQSIDLNQNSQCTCFLGFYNSNQQCFQCPNYSSNTPGQTAYKLSGCNTCQFQSYYMLQQATDTQNAVCAKCPYGTTLQTFNIQTTVLDVSACNNCMDGYQILDYGASASDGHPAKSAKCQRCPNNTFRNARLQSQDCLQCTSKFYGKIQQDGSVVCSLCPNNLMSNYFTQLPNGVTDCNICQKGYYNIGQSSNPPTCTKCPGQATSIYGGITIQQCVCDLNQYTVQIATQTTAAICQPCPNGSTRTSDIRLAGDESQCDYCQSGYYLLTPFQDSDGINPGKSANCQKCPNNSYSEQNISTSASVCSMCQLNYYMQTASDATTSAICLPCPNNTGTLDPVMTVGDANQCTVCQPGYYMIQPYKDGSNKPLTTAYKPSDCNTCQFLGYYMLQQATDTKNAVCAKCPYGTTLETNIQTTVQDVSACSKCIQGYIIIDQAASASDGNPAKSAKCLQCPNNTFRNFNIQSQDCKQCTSKFYGKVQQDGSVVCSLCPNNQMSNYQLDVPKGVTDCKLCQKGYYNIGQSSNPPTCTKCPGQTTSIFGGISIQYCVCDLNQYTVQIATQTTAAICKPCPNGSTRITDIRLPGDESQCDYCQSGYYLLTPFQDSDGINPGKSANCQKCPNNSYSEQNISTSVSVCSMCQLNYYMQTASDATTSAICLPCPNNTGTLDPVMTVGDANQCTVCQPGYYMIQPYKDGQQTSCKQCPTAQMKFQKTCLLLLVLIQLSYQYCHYANQPGLQNGDCSCITGFYSNNQNCQQCPNSSTSPFGIQALNPSDCSICPQGTHYMTQLASQPNQSASCTPCPNNSIFKGDPNSISDQSKCKTCNSGYYKVANAIIPSGDNGNLARAARCQKCPNNTFRFAILIPNMLDALDQVCSQCDDGFYVNSMVPRGQDARCSLCPNNSSQYSPPRIPNLSLRLLRPELPTFTSKDCNVCKLGYYNAETDPTKPVNCQQCPGGTTTLYPSSNNISSCICSQNQYITAISTPSSAASCLPCPTGSGRLVNYFNVVGDESQCDVCLEGYYLITPYQESDGISVAKGAQCQICPQNSYSVAGTSTSPSSCSLCKINFQMTNPADQSNSAQCQPCPDHTGTLAPASATTDVCNVCIAGYYMNQEFDNFQFSFSAMIKISILVILTLLL
ncbi:hypothetical protein ABPG73_017005, partial [Tetrahymena malaccensis]